GGVRASDGRHARQQHRSNTHISHDVLILMKGPQGAFSSAAGCYNKRAGFVGNRCERHVPDSVNRS
ncbi:MAG TPA: hypothetical protein VIT67_14955, partial [Povalibacter sp.]